MTRRQILRGQRTRPRWALGRTLVVATGLAWLLAAGAVTAPAWADDEVTLDGTKVSDSGRRVTAVLATDGLPAGVDADLDSVAVTLDGVAVESRAEPFVPDEEIQRTAVLALDSSLSMEGAEFAAAQEAARTFLENAPEDVEIGLVSFAADRRTTAPTSDRDALADAIADISLRRGTRVYDAVMEAVSLAGTDGVRSVLLLSDGRDLGKGATIEAAIASASEAGVVVDVVSLDQEQENLTQLARITDATNGRVVETDAAGLAGIFGAQAAALDTQLSVTFLRPDDLAGDVNLEVSIQADGTTYAADTLLRLPPLAGEPELVTADPGEAWIGPTGLWAGAAGLALGLAVIVAIALLDVTRRPTLAQRQIAHFSGGSADLSLRMGLGGASLRESAVAATERVVRGDFETRLSQRLSGAGSRLTAAEWLLLHVGLALGAAAAGAALAGPALAVIFLLGGAVLPWLWLASRHSRRLAAFNAQLPETLQLLASSLSAGLSMPQSVDTVVREGAEPMSGELRRALVEQRLGVQIDDALEGVAERMDSRDFGWVVMAIRIQREVGGNLSELLTTVASTLRERDYLRRQVRVLTAEGRVSAWTLGLLPIVLFVYLLLFRPDFVRPLYTQPLGLLLLGSAALLLSLGAVALTRMIRIEV